MMIAAAHLRPGDVLTTVPPGLGRYNNPPFGNTVTSNDPRAGFERTRRWVVIGEVSRIYNGLQLLDVARRA